MRPFGIPIYEIIGAFVIAIFGGIVSRYVHPKVVDIINAVRIRLDRTPRWTKILLSGIVIGVAIAYVPRLLSLVLTQLGSAGLQLEETVSTEVMLGFATIAILIFQYRQNTMIRSSLHSIESRIESLERTGEESTTGDGVRSEVDERVETSTGTDTDEKNEIRWRHYRQCDGQDRRYETGDLRGGMIGGAIAGGIMGSSGGPAGAVLGAIIGSTLGDALEQASVENEERKQLEKKLLRKLANKRVSDHNGVEVSTVVHWCPESEEEVREALHRLATDPNAPLQYADADETRVYLSGISNLEKYFDY